MPRVTPPGNPKARIHPQVEGLRPGRGRDFLALVAEDLEEIVRVNADLAARVERLTEENEEHRERERILKRRPC